MIPTRPNGDRPAFPTDRIADEAYHANGLSKREWFAGMALQGMLADHTREETWEGMARASLKGADALLAELAKDQDVGVSLSPRAAQACRAVCIDVAMKAAKLGRDIHRSTSFQEERALDGEVCICSAVQRPPCSFCEAPSLVALAEKAFEQATEEIKRLAEEEAKEASGRG